MDEVKDKSGKDIDVSAWEQDFVEDLPEQKNGYVFFIFSYMAIITTEDFSKWKDMHVKKLFLYGFHKRNFGLRNK